MKLNIIIIILSLFVILFSYFLFTTFNSSSRKLNLDRCKPGYYKDESDKCQICKSGYQCPGGKLLIECDDDYKYNKLFAEKISKVATQVIIVKEKNKKALLDGLVCSAFNIKNIRFVNSFAEIKDELINCDKDYVYLIENDLPDNYN